MIAVAPASKLTGGRTVQEVVAAICDSREIKVANRAVLAFFQNPVVARVSATTEAAATKTAEFARRRSPRLVKRVVNRLTSAAESLAGAAADVIADHLVAEVCAACDW
jgi:hypothetical protein